MGFERFPIAPLADGPAPGGGALEHRGHRAVGVLMRTADDRLGLHARSVHRLTVRGVEHRQQHLIGFVDPLRESGYDIRLVDCLYPDAKGKVKQEIRKVVQVCSTIEWPLSDYRALVKERFGRTTIELPPNHRYKFEFGLPLHRLEEFLTRREHFDMLDGERWLPDEGRVSHPLDGKQSFMTSPHRHSPLTSLAWSHRAPTPQNPKPSPAPPPVPWPLPAKLPRTNTFDPARTVIPAATLLCS